MATVTAETNRLDLFALAHLGSATDADRRRIIRLNPAYFAGRPTFWLAVGQELAT